MKKYLKGILATTMVLFFVHESLQVLVLLSRPYRGAMKVFETEKQ